jgi:hypothetical protein
MDWPHILYARPMASAFWRFELAYLTRDAGSWKSVGIDAPIRLTPMGRQGDQGDQQQRAPIE